MIAAAVAAMRRDSFERQRLPDFSKLSRVIFRSRRSFYPRLCHSRSAMQLTLLSNRYIGAYNITRANQLPNYYKTTASYSGCGRAARVKILLLNRCEDESRECGFDNGVRENLGT